MSMADELKKRTEDLSQESLAEAGEPASLLASIIETSDDAIISKDLRGVITSWNRAAEILYGYTAAEMVGQPVSIIIPSERQGEMAEILERIKRGERVDHFETVRMSKDGRRVEVSLTISPIKAASGKIIGASKIARNITERKRAEEALRVSEARYRTLFESTQDGIMIVNDEGSYIEVNESLCRILKTPRERLLGAHFSEFIPPDVLREAEQDFAELKNFSAFEGEFPLMAADGTKVELDWTSRANFVPGLHFCVARDITRRKRAEEGQKFLAEASTLIASSLNYETTLKSVTRMAVPGLADWCTVDILDESGALKRLAVAHVDPSKVEWAHELEKRFPVDMDAPRGVPNVLRTGASELYPDIPDAMLVESVKDPEQLRILRELGFTSAMIVPLVANRRTIGAISFITAESRHHYDAEDLALAEDLARRAALAIENARLYSAAQEANRIKDEFLATLSHELRTPLTAILGWAVMLRTGKFKEDAVSRALESIERNAKAQTQIVEDVLDVSRIITGKLRLDLRPLELAPFIQASVETLRPTAEAKGITLRATLEKDAGAIAADPARMQQVIWNLLSNAIKFTPKGGTVELRLERADSQARISLSDTGIGIRREFLPYVFDRFRQADGSISRRHGGLGLGLAIVRHLVELHGGTVRAESQGEGQGATFTIELPLLAESSLVVAAEDELPQAQAMVETDERIAVECPAALENLKVLIVDDEADARLLLTAVLENCGARVEVAQSAREALAAIERFRPDMLVSDIGMPDEDGYALIRKIRALKAEQGGRIPAIALSAYAREEDRLRALIAGYHTHVAKPVNPAELIAVISSLAGLRSRDER
ncbi:MAG TPA: PAS domain S-box protein [Pyrinomonadaceae bacterium]|jgi:PAS domain S-box-containing protein